MNMAGTIDDPFFVDEQERLSALASYNILDTPDEQGFDDIVLLATQLCHTPVALISFVDQSRQWFKARIGFPRCETSLNESVCAHALAQTTVLQIPDLTLDPRTQANPLVTADPHLRFYAGAPLVAPDQRVLGTLCVIDHLPRPAGLTQEQLTGLQALARQVMSQMELRRSLQSRDALLTERETTRRERNAFATVQAAIASAGGHIDVILNALVAGTMQAVPAAEGGVLELVDGDILEYRAVQGSLAPFVGERVRLSDSLAGHCVRASAPILAADVLADPRTNRDLALRLKSRSAVLAPVTRGDQVLGVLKLQSSLPNAFTARDLQITQLFSAAATAGLTEVSEVAALKAVEIKDAYWRDLFERLREGFIVGRVIRDDVGHIVDWRYEEVNKAWGDLVGVSSQDAVGHTIREVFPGIEDEWIQDFAQVVDHGRSITFTRRAGDMARWYEGRAHKITDDTFAVLFLEVTERVLAERARRANEARKEALLELGDRLRDIETVPQMTQVAAEIVGRTMGVTRAGFGRLDATAEYVEIEPDWTVAGMSSIAGRHRFADYGDIRADLMRGEPLIIEDVRTDPRTAPDPGPMLAVQIHALINMPVRERGRTVSVFIVQDSRPRHWTAEEVGFLRAVADRLEVGVARLQSEHQQRLLNYELSHRMKNTLAMVQAVAVQTLKSVPDREAVEAFTRRLHALSTAHDVLLDENWTAAKIETIATATLLRLTLPERFQVSGPAIELGPRATLSLSLLLHELMTNAMKYGSLSCEGGHVKISWHAEDAGDDTRLILAWREHGGPPPREPSRRGFGSRLIRMGLVGTGGVELRYPASGFEADFEAPLDQVRHS
ncbi:GAF domain-containing protein [Lichenifustis flavocetrariae]|uniref:histidine kinase n=1 Tax=Lichenifustis flavocetrariae TaxID=2949735 RepID=A0AA42CKV5_9HYPH|nr:GAF domain-containing protein [Lichenifustis flavocetrariae]MCW6506680.1 GAF domain-containing protein [Lichenifustis flavocetrariae]